ncbi:uncharacterized protein LOC21399460 [Morus notabilis]|uniref:uncharacterized protein LOC21399460 n=1 Tax=Morus notabilis TaxID=981085 RepID=UPI000CECF0F8|nr:uncharacterized protein LOC21399460 [Morus notabilis]
MLDSFFNKGFKAAKCKTLLKLAIPRIKLLRNRREVQLKQMRRDIAKLLETGQEATARIRVEHIIREENMMAAQEIIELFCELITVRLPIIETQRECPLDLKEAISSVCFAAPRCADLPELLQVQILFASKYGKEFVAAATELIPDCGVNRQLIELLSVRAPSPEKKLKLLKEIAEEHELDWDPAASESEFFKSHEDLLNGPTQFVSGSKLPLPKEKNEEISETSSNQAHQEQHDSDNDLDDLDFPEVPKVSVRPGEHAASAPSIVPPPPIVPPHPEIDHESTKHSVDIGNPPEEPEYQPEKVVEERSMAKKDEKPHTPVGGLEDKQFVPFIAAPSLSSSSFSVRQSSNSPPPPLLRTRSEAKVDLQDVLAAAQAAADSAERAAAAARSAASLAQVRINELSKKTNDQVPPNSSENPFHTGSPGRSASLEKPHFDRRNSTGDSDSVSSSPKPHHIDESVHGLEASNLSSVHSLKADFDAALPESDPARHQPQRLPSMDDEPYFSYPNLFRSQSSNLRSGAQSFKDNSHSPDER